MESPLSSPTRVHPHDTALLATDWGAPDAFQLIRWALPEDILIATLFNQWRQRADREIQALSHPVHRYFESLPLDERYKNAELCGQTAADLQQLVDLGDDSAAVLQRICRLVTRRTDIPDNALAFTGEDLRQAAFAFHRMPGTFEEPEDCRTKTRLRALFEVHRYGEQNLLHALSAWAEYGLIHGDPELNAAYNDGNPIPALRSLAQTRPLMTRLDWKIEVAGSRPYDPRRKHTLEHLVATLGAKATVTQRENLQHALYAECLNRLVLQVKGSFFKMVAEYLDVVCAYWSQINKPESAAKKEDNKTLYQERVRAFCERTDHDPVLMRPPFAWGPADRPQEFWLLQNVLHHAAEWLPKSTLAGGDGIPLEALSTLVDLTRLVGTTRYLATYDWSAVSQIDKAMSYARRADVSLSSILPTDALWRLRAEETSAYATGSVLVRAHLVHDFVLPYLDPTPDEMPGLSA